VGVGKTYWAVLKSHGDRVAVDASHEQTEQGANGKELAEAGAVNGRDLQDPQDYHVEHHWPEQLLVNRGWKETQHQQHSPFTAELITRQTKDCRPDRSKQ
jgi:hypothetical protein